MTTQVKNVKKEIFTSKEHYLHFRQAWKDFINSGKAKPWFEEHYGGRTRYTNLRGSHHLLFNILTEKDISITFKPSVNESKHGFNDAYNEMYRIFKAATVVDGYDNNTGDKASYLTNEQYKRIVDTARGNVTKFLEPFGSSFTMEMFMRLMREHVHTAQLTNVKEEELQVTPAAA